jgi:hypothetical protein
MEIPHTQTSPNGRILHGESGHIDLSILHISAKIYITLGVCEWNKVKCKAISNSLPIFISIFKLQSANSTKQYFA